MRATTGKSSNANQAADRSLIEPFYANQSHRRTLTVLCSAAWPRPSHQGIRAEKLREPSSFRTILPPDAATMASAAARAMAVAVAAVKPLRRMKGVSKYTCGPTWPNAFISHHPRCAWGLCNFGTCGLRLFDFSSDAESIASATAAIAGMARNSPAVRGARSAPHTRINRIVEP